MLSPPPSAPAASVVATGFSFVSIRKAGPRLTYLVIEAWHVPSDIYAGGFQGRLRYTTPPANVLGWCSIVARPFRCAEPVCADKVANCHSNSSSKRLNDSPCRMHSSIWLAGSGGGRLAFLLTGRFPSHYCVRRRKDHERCEYRYSSKFFHFFLYAQRGLVNRRLTSATY
jgi:hypothetical protein